MSTFFTDPVCGLLVHPMHAAGVVDHEGTTYYFCGEECQTRFIAEYLVEARRAKTPLRLVLDDRQGRIAHLVEEPEPDRITAS